ncbi:MAG: hypothetical protein ACR2LS_03840 [Thermomicrobiales bacterium]
MTCDYMQVVAQHHAQPEQLLLRCPDDRYFLWFGDDRKLEVLEETDERLARWLEEAAIVYPLREPRFWLHIDDLPLVQAPMERPVPRR